MTSGFPRILPLQALSAMDLRVAPNLAIAMQTSLFHSKAFFLDFTT